MSRFETPGHLIAWAGLCPGQNESAGKRKRTRLRKGAPWLKTMLVQCAWAAQRANASYYKAQFFRLKARRGPQKAICAVAASILTAIHHMLRASRRRTADVWSRKRTGCVALILPAAPPCAALRGRAFVHSACEACVALRLREAAASPQPLLSAL
jgi:hypothetical protein